LSRYFVNTLNGNDEPDDVGVDLDGIKDVRILAIRFLGELLHDQALAGHPDLDWQLNVTDGGRDSDPVLVLKVSMYEPTGK
jgi:hypothetical protein